MWDWDLRGRRGRAISTLMVAESTMAPFAPSMARTQDSGEANWTKANLRETPEGSRMTLIFVMEP